MKLREGYVGLGMGCLAMREGDLEIRAGYFVVRVG
jgi:hypothetical protein